MTTRRPMTRGSLPSSSPCPCRTSPTCWDASTLLGRALGWRRTENRRRHFDQVTNWPDGFLVMGDGLVSLNPVYGQGMSVAALSATQLHLQLAETGDGGARTRGWSSRVQQALAEEVSLAWNIASGADYVVPGASTVPLTPRQDEFLRRWNRANVLAFGEPGDRPAPGRDGFPAAGCGMDVRRTHRGASGPGRGRLAAVAPPGPVDAGGPVGRRPQGGGHILPTGNCRCDAPKAGPMARRPPGDPARRAHGAGSQL